MKTRAPWLRLFTTVLILSGYHVAHAGMSPWEITRLSSPSISVPKNGTGMVQYKITNLSHRDHILVLNKLTGITQITGGPGQCPNPFSLSGHSSCILTLQINGRQFNAGKPFDLSVCEYGHELMCYTSDPQSALTVQLTDAADPEPESGINMQIADDQYFVGGTVSNLSGTVYLQMNSLYTQVVSGNDAFSFADGLPSGATYDVTVQAHPNGEICSVVHGTGIITNNHITNVHVTCAPDAYTVSGTISGLNGTISLLNNGLDLFTTNENGRFTFSTPIAQNSPYELTVASQPNEQHCEVIQGSGTISGENITNPSILCTQNLTTLSASLPNLALQTLGNPRIITLKNTGSSTAQDLSIAYRRLPSGTSATSTCEKSLAPNEECVITIIPGATATSHCDVIRNTPPTPDIITVTASNVSAPVNTGVQVLTLGCIYQSGYLFDLDDTTPTTGSIGGTTASLKDNASFMQWFNGTFLVTNASSFKDGASNTRAIVNTQGTGIYAAQLCNDYSIDASGNSPCQTGICYDHWYLPAICQLGAPGQGAGCSGTANISTNLSGLIQGCNGPQCISGYYWSSTEYLPTPQFGAWDENFGTSGNSQYGGNKDGHSAVRCTRTLIF